MIYAMSDIHGCIDALEDRLKQVDLSGDNKIVFLGDYIDYGRQSGRVLERILSLQQEYGSEKVIVLKGNHEAMLLEWIDNFKVQRYSAELEALSYDSWLKTDSQHRFNTYRTLVSLEAFETFQEYAKKESFTEINMEAVRILLDEKKELISWINKMPSYYHTDDQIFVHAGVDEEAEEYWMWGSSDDIFLWKHPATFGEFIKPVIAGHIGTAGLARDKFFHDVYYDGDSHYYIDGSVYKHGKLILLAYDEAEDKYWQIEGERRVPIISRRGRL